MTVLGFCFLLDEVFFNVHGKQFFAEVLEPATLVRMQDELLDLRVLFELIH